MKYIEMTELARLAQALTHEGPECSVHTRIEAYSCKNIKRDKKLFRSLESAYADEVSHSPPLPSEMALDRESEMTPFGPMQESQSRKTLYLLIATLNVAFPDHEFSDVRPYHFNREESGASVLNALSTTLVSPQRSGLQAPRTYSSYPPSSSDFFPSTVPTSSSPLDFYVKPSPRAPSKAQSGTHPYLYQTLDKAIHLAECEVYSYTPDIEFDPHANDYEDDEDDLPSAGEEDASDDDDGVQFQFDDYDVDEAPQRRRSTGSSDEHPDAMPLGRTRRRRGALLWSSHWFFLNRKLKRILFISVWARSKGVTSYIDEDIVYGSPGKATNERFLGWEGAVGAGARAMGLSTSAHM
ncbi:Maf1-domain-containing protein [Trametes coccinea BRFM310]|uniref:Repressor of RNA polymerase III transcription MAF1 n=1 Tax=Trametes coccinea (strain BRFM310) TaxID=1353009 RepID=A0A1Y2IFB7_TRAC3|nr:Maf1-domain-containing protein [Trametes coccinea BRFM310]